MPPAIIAAGVGAVGAIGGAVLSSHSANSAASQANASQQQATQAELQLGQQNLAQQQAIYNSNYNMLSPFVSRGNVAGNSINALLGLPAAPAMTSPLAAATPGTAGAPTPTTATGSLPPSQVAAMQNDGIPGNYQAYYAAHPAELQALRNDGIPGNYAAATGQSGGGLLGGVLGVLSPAAGVLGLGGANTSISRYVSPGLVAASGGFGGGSSGGGTSGTPAPATAPAPGGVPAPAPAPTPAVNALTASQAMNNFANSAGMQFQLQQGANALNNLYAAHGQLQSGAAMKAMQGYGQQTALNNYFLPYMNLLGGQQSVGAGAGSAVAGVGSSFGNTASNIYSGMGNALQGGADASSNAALLRGYNNGQMWNGIGSALGNLGSSFFPTHS